MNQNNLEGCMLNIPTTFHSYIDHSQNDKAETLHSIEFLLPTTDELLSSGLNSDGDSCTTLSACFNPTDNSDYEPYELYIDNGDDFNLVMPFPNAHAMFSMIAMLFQLSPSHVNTTTLIKLGFTSDT